MEHILLILFLIRASVAQHPMSAAVGGPPAETLPPPVIFGRPPIYAPHPSSAGPSEHYKEIHQIKQNIDQQSEKLNNLNKVAVENQQHIQTLEPKPQNTMIMNESVRRITQIATENCKPGASVNLLGILGNDPKLVGVIDEILSIREQINVAEQQVIACNNKQKCCENKAPVASPKICPKCEPQAGKAIFKQMKRNQGSYLGCFIDNDKNPILRGSVKKSNDNSVEKCYTQCRNGGFVYAGLKAGNMCMCGLSFPNPEAHPKVDDGQCNTPCTGAPGKNCGGSTQMAFYETGLEIYMRGPDGNVIEKSYLQPSNYRYYGYQEIEKDMLDN